MLWLTNPRYRALSGGLSSLGRGIILGIFKTTYESFVLFPEFTAHQRWFADNHYVLEIFYY